VIITRVACAAGLGAVLLAATGCQTGGQRDGAMAEQAAPIERAVCVLEPVGDNDVNGVVHFVRDGNAVRVKGRVAGLKPGRHGFHVHRYGDLTDEQAAKSAGSHYAPEDNPHGRMTSGERHVGDLGNIVANAEGVATIDMRDDVIELNGPQAVVGRALIIHADPDEFVQPTGHAGPRVAAGVIGIAPPS
jgi:Cu-Zn family superoxide dismutase